jgi:hypothetical protein
MGGERCLASSMNSLCLLLKIAAIGENKIK